MKEKLKQELKEYISEREAIEREIEECMMRLESQNNVGMKGSLVDSDGYPRSDIDIFSVRTDRQKVIMLSNDHKDVSKKIEEHIHTLHSLTKNSINNTENKSKNVYKPFAIVDSVSLNSPAKNAGIEVGDKLCKFGKIFLNGNYDVNMILKDISEAVQENEGKEVETIFERNNRLVSMKLTPQRWGGKGLIGCHLLPIKSNII